MHPDDATPTGVLTRTEVLAERADVFRMARAILDQYEWEDGVDVIDTLILSRFLLGELKEGDE